MTIELTESEWRMVLRKLHECSYPEDERKLAAIANLINLRLKHLSKAA